MEKGSSMQTRARAGGTRLIALMVGGFVAAVALIAVLMFVGDHDAATATAGSDSAPEVTGSVGTTAGASTSVGESSQAPTTSR
jgi:flagellar basal body-associated protein FliL